MPKKRKVDTALVHSVAGNLFEALPVFPKRLLMTDRIQRVYHMPVSHMQILISLQEGDLSVGELSRRLDIAKPNVTPLVDALRNDGLVERIRDVGDRRIVNVHLLPAGEARLKEMKATVAARVETWAENLSRSELKELNNALASIVRIVGQLPDGE